MGKRLVDELVMDINELDVVVVLVWNIELVKLDDRVELSVAIDTMLDVSSGTGVSPSWTLNISDRKSCQSDGLLASPNIFRALERSLYFPDGMSVPLPKDWNLVNPTALNLPMNCIGKFEKPP
ncbi:MAG: hypothetical protein CL912_12315 [Deltaproteobacteria bacterium]|nr:hypothetical protein [Deltaproteobacteria bacterium]